MVTIKRLENQVNKLLREYDETPPDNILMRFNLVQELFDLYFVPQENFSWSDFNKEDSVPQDIFKQGYMARKLKKLNIREMKGLILGAMNILDEYAELTKYARPDRSDDEGIIARTEYGLSIFPFEEHFRRNLQSWYEYQGSWTNRDRIEELSSDYYSSINRPDILNQFLLEMKELNVSNITTEFFLYTLGSFVESRPVMAKKVELIRLINRRAREKLAHDRGFYESVMGGLMNTIDQERKTAIAAINRSRKRMSTEEIRGELKLIQKEYSSDLDRLALLESQFHPRTREILKNERRRKFYINLQRTIENKELWLEDALQMVETSVPLIRRYESPAGGGYAQAIIYKIGGSTFDKVVSLVNNKKKEEARDLFNKIIQNIKKVHNERPVVLTAGGGPSGDLAKVYRELFGFSEKDYGTFAVVDPNITVLKLLLGDTADVIPAENIFDLNSRFMKEKIAIIPYAPRVLTHYLFGESTPLSESDGHTLALSPALNIPEIIFVKDTKGVQEWDPAFYHMPDDVAEVKKEYLEERSLLAENIRRIDPKKRPKILKEVSIDEFRYIPRVGPLLNDKVTKGHLVEDKAIEYFKMNVFPKGTHIRIVNCNTPNQIYQASKNKSVGSVIYNPKNPPNSLSAETL